MAWGCSGCGAVVRGGTSASTNCPYCHHSPCDRCVTIDERITICGACLPGIRTRTHPSEMSCPGCGTPRGPYRIDYSYKTVARCDCRGDGKRPKNQAPVCACGHYKCSECYEFMVEDNGYNSNWRDTTTYVESATACSRVIALKKQKQKVVLFPAPHRKARRSYGFTTSDPISAEGDNIISFLFLHHLLRLRPCPVTQVVQIEITQVANAQGCHLSSLASAHLFSARPIRGRTELDDKPANAFNRRQLRNPSSAHPNLDKPFKTTYSQSPPISPTMKPKASPYEMNAFRILGDVSHTLSFLILILAIHSNRSAEGVSLITQAFYLLLFVARYLDLFWTPFSASYWNSILKIFFMTSTAYTLFIMLRLYPRTRERETAWKLGTWCLAGSAALAPLAVLVLNPHHAKAVLSFEWPWTFSIILESVCVLPQLLLLRQTDVPTVLSSYYLLTLGSYRAFYLINWIFRSARHKSINRTAVVFGVVQTAFYVDFAWVYWSRQRVKLRGGGVVDEDDLGKGWLLRRVFGQVGGGRASADEERGGAGGREDEPAGATGGGGGRWGARGISVSADEGVEDQRREIEANNATAGAGAGKHKAKADDPKATSAELAGILEGDESDEDDGILPAVGGDTAGAVVGNGQEWRK